MMGAFDDLIPQKKQAGNFADLVPQEPRTPQEKAKAWLDAHPEAQHGLGSNLAGKFVQGATLGWGDEALAGAAAVRDMIKHGGSFSDNYALEKAMQDEQLRRASEETGIVGTAAELVGGIGTGLGAAKAGLTAIGPGQGLVKSIAAGAAEGAGYGAISGAGGADGNRLSGAVNGAMLGGGIGGAAPAVVAAAKPFVSPIISNIHARISPEGYARNQLGKTLERSGMTAQQVQDEMARAAAAGQGNYVLADALGESGQKQLAGLMKSPGSAKQEAAEWLAARNSGMGRNVQGFVDDAFNTHGNTAQEFTDLMEAARSQAGDIRYDAARAGAGPVDLTGTMTRLESLRNPAGVAGVDLAAQGVAPPGVERAAKMLSREAIGDTTAANFDLLLQQKSQLSDMAQEAMRAGRTREAGQIGAVIDELDAALSAASPGYRTANDTFERMSQPINAVPLGRKAATSGRSADNINRFNDLERPGQQGFRVGYADKLNEGLGSPHVGNKINDMLHGDVADEIGAFATPGKADMLRERLQRSQDMLRTGNLANGGSPTAELLGQQSDIGIDPIAAAGSLASGNIGGLLRQVAGGVMNGANGNTEAVRNTLIPMLLSGKVGNGANANLGSLLQALESQVATRNALGVGVKRGFLSGLLPMLMTNSYADQPANVNVTPEAVQAFQSRIPR